MSGAIKYPQLHNQAWMEANESLGAVRIAEKLGCSRKQASEMMRVFGLGSRQKAWSWFEKRALEEFFPEWPTEFIAQALNRSEDSVTQAAYRRGLTKADRIDDFWEEWGKFTIKCLEDVFGLTYKPGKDIDCDECGMECDRDSDKFPCQRVTVGEWFVNKLNNNRKGEGLQ